MVECALTTNRPSHRKYASVEGEFSCRTTHQMRKRKVMILERFYYLQYGVFFFSEFGTHPLIKLTPLTRQPLGVNLTDAQSVRCAAYSYNRRTLLVGCRLGSDNALFQRQHGYKMLKPVHLFASFYASYIFCPDWCYGPLFIDTGQLPSSARTRHPTAVRRQWHRVDGGRRWLHACDEHANVQRQALL